MRASCYLFLFLSPPLSPPLSRDVDPNSSARNPRMTSSRDFPFMMSSINAEFGGSDGDEPKMVAGRADVLRPDSRSGPRGAGSVWIDL